MKIKIILSIAIFLSLTTTTQAKARDFVSPMLPEEAMYPGDRMFSENNAYRLEFRVSGNLVIIRNSDDYVMWVSQTAGSNARYLGWGGYRGGCGGQISFPVNLHLIADFNNYYSNTAWCARGRPYTGFPYGPTVLILGDDGRAYTYQTTTGLALCAFDSSCAINYYRLYGP